MPERLFNRRQSRLVDEIAVEEYGISGLVLMENAGRGAVDAVERLGLGVSFAICCGRGNNGGDGFVMARHLQARGYAVRVLLFADPASLACDAAVNFAILEQCEIPVQTFTGRPSPAELDAALAGVECVVDALLGTGSKGGPRPPLDAVIAAINRVQVPVVAVDLPSGLDCDTGAAAPHAVRAAHTVTFVAAKSGFAAPGAAAYVGRVHVVDLGLPPALLDEIAASV